MPPYSKRDKWEYNRGYDHAYNWGGSYDYNSHPGPDYDAGFMAGYFKKYGYTYEGKTYTQLEEEKRANNQIQYQNYQPLKTIVPSSDTLIARAFALLLEILRMAVLMFLQSEEQSAKNIFGSISPTTVNLVKILKALVFVVLISIVTGVHSLFK